MCISLFYGVDASRDDCGGGEGVENCISRCDDNDYENNKTPEIFSPVIIN